MQDEWNNNVCGRTPIFSGENYGIWKTQMEALLHKARLLKIVKGEILPSAEPQKKEKFEEKDRMHVQSF